MNRILKISSALAASALLCVFALRAAEAAFGHGEKLVYAVRYRAAVVPKTAVGRATLECRQSGPFYEITANGRTLPFFRWFFDLDDTYVCRLDTATLRPVSLDSRIFEGGYQFESHFDYDWNAMQVSTRYRNKRWSQERTRVHGLNSESFDAVALFYNLRSRPLDGMTAGKPQTLHLVLEDTVRTIDYRFLGRETIKLRGIGKIAALKFRCQIAVSSTESFADGTEFTLWLSDDGNRIPLQIDSPVRVGSVAAELKEYSGLKYPLALMPD